MKPPRGDSIPGRVLRAVADWPPLNALAHVAARAAAGSHHVGAIAVVIPECHPGDIDGHVMLARHMFHGGRWGLPAGWVRRREDPAAACRREVREETGIDVRAVDVVGCELHAVEGVPGRHGGITIAYWCVPSPDGQPEPTPRSVELTDVRWVAAGEAADLVTGFERAMIERALHRAGCPLPRNE